jgi:hypothetical protein
MTKRRITDAIIPVVARLQPMARIAERVAQLAVHMQRPTPLGVAGMAATGLAALADHLGNSRGPGRNVSTLLSTGQVIDALREAGAALTVTKHHDGSDFVSGSVHAVRFCLNPNGSISTFSDVDDGFVEWMRQAFDRVLPSVVGVRGQPASRSDRPSGYEASPLRLTALDSEQATQIIDATLPLLGEGRCILLNGRPGVGKTTLAQIIARSAGLGRTVILEPAVVGAERGDGFGDGMPTAERCIRGGDLRDAIRLLSPGVAIVDDVDKVRLSLANLEAIRAAAKLVILTANNGQHDEVLDGALTRAGRVDEVFEIAPVAVARVAPFDRLDDAAWAEVSQWPIAYVTELRKRLATRPDNLRLDDLRERLTKRTRSGESLR